jgi:drug/metabolite transporter (DMT)-like permease
MNVNAVGIVVFWYTVTLVFNWTAFNLVVLKDDPALALLPADITLIEMFACTICGALTLYNKGLGFIPPPGLRIRMLVLALANAAACQLFMFAMDFVALSLIQTIRACQPILTVFVGESRSHGRHACRGDVRHSPDLLTSEHLCAVPTQCTSASAKNTTLSPTPR